MLAQDGDSDIRSLAQNLIQATACFVQSMFKPRIKRFIENIIRTVFNDSHGSGV